MVFVYWYAGLGSAALISHSRILLCISLSTGCFVIIITDINNLKTQVNYFMKLVSIVLLLALGAQTTTASHKKAADEAVYEYEETARRADKKVDEVIMTFDDYGNIEDRTSKSASKRRLGEFIIQSDDLEDYIDTALSGQDHLQWQSLAAEELPKNPQSNLVAQFATVNVPLFYGDDADRYGIVEERYKRSFFAIRLRRYYWGSMDLRRPIKHVILVAGGPGESGQIYIRDLNQFSKQYGRQNLILYVADHRGVYKSRDIVELVPKEDASDGKSRSSWRNRPHNKYVSEDDWIDKVKKFEKEVGFPLVAVSCSSAAKDLALISMVLKRLSRNSGDHAVSNPDLFYIHAQSYGTQVTVRALNILPKFYEAVLLEGLATMETVKESAKSDFGILSSCTEDEKCFRMFSDSSQGATISASRLIRMENPFDLHKLLEMMDSGNHNAACRRIFLTEMRDKLYSAGVTFWDALHLSMYELLTDDFINPYTGNKGNFYPGMLVLFLIRDMYYCRNPDKFRRQVLKYIEVIAMSARGLDRPYVKKPKSKGERGSEAQSDFSHFVQTYINAHEAFDMAAMTKSSEKAYCDVPNQPDLVNQCHLWTKEVTKMKFLVRISGRAESVKTVKSPKIKKDAVKRLFDGDPANRNQNISESSDRSESSDEEINHHRSNLYKAGGGLKSFEYMNSKSSRKGKKKKKKHHNHKKVMKKKDILEGIKWSKSFKSVESLKLDPEFFESPKKPLAETKASSNDSGVKDEVLGFRRYYYDVDELAYAAPKTTSKIFVSVGTLDVKTPLLEARKLLSSIRAPLKALFELKNVAHSTGPCRTEIIRAMVAEANRVDFHEALARADECVRALTDSRKLDWELDDVKNIPKEDWIS